MTFYTSVWLSKWSISLDNNLLYDSNFHAIYKVTIYILIQVIYAFYKQKKVPAGIPCSRLPVVDFHPSTTTLYLLSPSQSTSCITYWWGYIWSLVFSFDLPCYRKYIVKVGRVQRRLLRMLPGHNELYWEIGQARTLYLGVQEAMGWLYGGVQTHAGNW